MLYHLIKKLVFVDIDKVVRQGSWGAITHVSLFSDRKWATSKRPPCLKSAFLRKYNKIAKKGPYLPSILHKNFRTMIALPKLMHCNFLYSDECRIGYLGEQLLRNQFAELELSDQLQVTVLMKSRLNHICKWTSAFHSLCIPNGVVLKFRVVEILPQIQLQILFGWRRHRHCFSSKIVIGCWFWFFEAGFRLCQIHNWGKNRPNHSLNKCQLDIVSFRNTR